MSVPRVDEQVSAQFDCFNCKKAPKLPLSGIESRKNCDSYSNRSVRKWNRTPKLTRILPSYLSVHTCHGGSDWFKTPCHATIGCLFVRFIHTNFLISVCVITYRHVSNCFARVCAHIILCESVAVSQDTVNLGSIGTDDVLVNSKKQSVSDSLNCNDILGNLDFRKSGLCLSLCLQSMAQNYSNQQI